MKNLIISLENKNIFTSKLAFARAILAIGTLLTIMFCNINIITDTTYLQPDAPILPNSSPLTKYSIYSLLGNNWGKVLSIVILLFVISGYFPKLSSLLHAWVTISLTNSFTIIDGGDQIAGNLTLLLIPICLFDNRINQWVNNPSQPSRKAVNVFANTIFFLICLQGAVIYLHAGVGKMYKEEWLNGTSMYYWFANNVFGAPNWAQEFLYSLSLSTFAPILTWSVIFLELGLFACILANSNVKRIFLFLALGFHFTIFLVHGLSSFFFSMAGLLILYLDNENYILEKVISLKSLFKINKAKYGQLQPVNN